MGTIKFYSLLNEKDAYDRAQTYFPSFSMNHVTRKILITGSIASFIGLSTYFGYAAVSGVWTDTSTLESSSGATLSSTAWNKILGNLQQLKDASVAPGTIASIKMVQTRTLATYTSPVNTT